MSPQYRIILARTIKRHRRAAGMSKYALAMETGIPQSTILRLEAGKIEAPDPDKIERIACALEIEPEELFAAYPAPERLPAMAPYLRAKFGMSDDAVTEAEQFFSDLAGKDGRKDDGGKRSR